jgi:hypothetical protein
MFCVSWRTRDVGVVQSSRPRLPSHSYPRHRLCRPHRRRTTLAHPKRLAATNLATGARFVIVVRLLQEQRGRWLIGLIVKREQLCASLVLLFYLSYHL